MARDSPTKLIWIQTNLSGLDYEQGQLQNVYTISDYYNGASHIYFEPNNKILHVAVTVTLCCLSCHYKGTSL